MPYPSKLTSQAIITQAWEQIDQHGIEAFSLHKLAAHFDVKTPSLYRYVNKTELLREVNTETSKRLFAELYPVIEEPIPSIERARNLAHQYRAFAHRHRHTYSLLFTNNTDDFRPDDAQQVQAVLPLQHLIADLTGETQSLPALRGLVALLHGFVMLEFSQQLRRDSNLDDAFRFSVDTYLHGLQSTP
jgi:AcrR family transcriptional regulator